MSSFDAVENLKVNIFLLHDMRCPQEAAADYGLDLETAQNFHEFYAQE